MTDPTSLREELGGEAGFAELVRTAKAAGLGLVVDIVPNHMAADPANRWWRDVLENGRSSRYATMFDIDWEQPEERLRGKVVLPILADHYGRELEAGRIRLVSVDGQFEIRYFDHVLPVVARVGSPRDRRRGAQRGLRRPRPVARGAALPAGAVAGVER